MSPDTVIIIKCYLDVIQVNSKRSKTNEDNIFTINQHINIK
jgi:hypothetical protein